MEFGAGFGWQFALHLWGPGHAEWKYVAGGLGGSAFYEAVLDRHGWSWRDVLQRAVGQFVGEVIWLLVFQH